MGCESRRGALTWLVLAVGVCYTNALSGEFQFDDYKVIVDNPAVQSWAAWWASAGHGIRPLLKLSYTLNWTSGLGLTGFHLVNLLIHLGNVWLVYRLSEQFVNARDGSGRLQDAPLLAALLFAVHPIHTEAVTYVSGRSASLMALFYLAGLLTYAIGRTTQRKVFLYALTPLLMLAALGVKETAVTFPLALLLWEWSCGGGWRASVQRQWPGWVVWLAAAAFFLLNENYAGQMQRSADLNSLQGNVATQLGAAAYLLRQWALPLWLNIDPDLPLKADFTGMAAPLALAAVLLAGVLRYAHHRPWITFALTWLALHLMALYLFLPRLDIANERQMVLADWPLFLALGIELRLGLRGATFKVAAAALLLALAGLTLLRNQVYFSEIALWQDTAAKSAQKARVHNNLGYAYQLAARTADARREFELALLLDPDQVQARLNRRRLESP